MQNFDSCDPKLDPDHPGFETPSKGFFEAVIEWFTGKGESDGGQDAPTDQFGCPIEAEPTDYGDHHC